MVSISTIRGTALQIYPEPVDPRSLKGFKNLSEHILNAAVVKVWGKYENSKEIDVTNQNC